MNRSIGAYGEDVVVKSLAHGRICEIGRREPIQQLLHYRNYLTGSDDVALILLVRERVVHGNQLRCPRKEALGKIPLAFQRRRHLELIQPLRHGVRFIVVREEKEQLAPLAVIEARDKERTAQRSSDRVETITAFRLPGEVIEIVVRIQGFIPKCVPQRTVKVLRS